MKESRMKAKSLRQSPLSFANLLGIILLLSLTFGCATKPDDAKITSDVQGKFGQDSGLGAKQLTVQASNGVVTLAGAVDNEAQRDAAARQAATVPGVKEVVNNLQVGTAAALPASAPAPAPPAKQEEMASAPPAEKTKPTPTRKSHKHSSDTSSRTADLGNRPDSNSSVASQNPDPGMANNNTGPLTPPADVVPSTPPPPPPPKRLIIDQGTQLTIRLVDPIDSEKNQTGDTFHATLNAPLTSDGEEAIPAGTDITGHLVDVKSAGKFQGQSQVVLQLDSISAGGKTYTLQTDQYKKTGSSRGKNTAEKVGGGALIGGIIGAIAGGGKGAAIGAAAGGGIGGGVQAATKGQQIKLPSETVLNFTLQAPVTVMKALDPNSDRQKLGNS